MKEWDLRNYFNQAIEPNLNVVSALSESVESGLSLSRGIGSRADPDVKYGMVTEIAKTTYYASNFLDTPWPNFGLIYEWGREMPGQDNSKFIVLANARVDKSNPNGLICYSPLYLETIADYWMGRNDLRSLHFGNGSPLEKVTAHENFHIHQFYKFPHTVQIQTELLNSSDGNQQWESVRVERSARLFEDIFHSARTRFTSE